MASKKNCLECVFEKSLCSLSIEQSLSHICVLQGSMIDVQQYNY